jgi:hypothetical protein
VQRWLTRVIFLRTTVDRGVAALRDTALRTADEEEYLAEASTVIASFLSASHFEVMEDTRLQRFGEVSAAVVKSNPADAGAEFPSWVHAVTALHFAGGGSRVLMLGARAGGRRYLSEDIRALERLSAIVCEHVERARASEMQNLISQAELRALQAQINPHFLFNSLNTLYGTIHRENASARQLVTNLSSLFRYVLTSERTFIRLEEEIRIVHAYLEIEQLRLGPKLETRLEIDDDVLEVDIPVFSIQPLVENAVKHGVATRQGSGYVEIAIHRTGDAVSVVVSNSGPFRMRAQSEDGAGIGLANVRKRLSLCYGPASRIAVDSGADYTSISFTFPILRTSHASV